MRTKRMRLISFVLALAMMLAIAPVGAFAANEKKPTPSDGHYEITVTEKSDAEYAIADKNNKSGVQKALEAEYEFSSADNDRFDAVKSLTVHTAPGIVLNKVDFQFIGGVKVNSATSYNYAGGNDNPAVMSKEDASYYWLRNLTEVDLTDANLKDDKFPERAFCGNTKIEAVIFPSTLVNAGFKTFCYMDELTYVGTKEGEASKTIIFPATMTTIENAAFFEDHKLDCKLILPATVTFIGQGAFQGDPITGEIVIRAGVTLENNGAHIFHGTKISSLEIENGMEEIGAAIVQNTPINNITIPNNIKKINDYAFYYGSYTTPGERTINETIVIPESVEYIGEGAFSYAGNSIKNIIVGNENITLGAWALNHLNAKIYFKNAVNNSGTSNGHTNVVWDSNISTIFNTNGGTIPTDGNGNVTAKTDSNGFYIPVKDTEKFVEWETTDNCKTYTAKWEAKKQYTVTFDLNGQTGTAPETQSVYEGNKATAPQTAPTADGYKFDGWYTDTECTKAFDFGTAIEANTTLYAKWSKALIPVTMKYAVTVEDGTACVKDADGNEVVKAGDTIYVEEGQTVTITANDTIADGMTFDRWEVREGDVQLANERSATTTFTMGTKPVKVAAMPATEASDDGIDAATVITGVAIGAGAAVLTYHIGTELYAEQVLGDGVAVPKTREEVALKAWELAGKPAVELNGEPLSEAAQAETWAVESGLMQNVDGSFNGAKKMNKLKALRTLDSAKKMNAQ